jgi:transcriptional repressor NrdR
MKCPFCGENNDRVVDSREHRDGETIRRRRHCLHCDRRFTSYEQIEDIRYMAIKNDGSRQNFDRHKVASGLSKACEKRPISPSQMEEIVDAVESRLHTKAEREISTHEIGEVIMERLKNLDHVAYIRFASVYRRFEAVEEFAEMLSSLPSKDS